MRQDVVTGGRHTGERPRVTGGQTRVTGGQPRPGDQGRSGDQRLRAGDQRLRERGTVLAAIPEAPRTCRSIVRTALHVRGLAGLADDAETVVTELASNAARAMRAEEAAGRLGGDVPVIALVLSWCERGVRIEIWDRAPGIPQMTEPDWEAERGRGLFMVNQVTGGRWGCRTAGDSKCVWADLGNG